MPFRRIYSPLLVACCLVFCRAQATLQTHATKDGFPVFGLSNAYWTVEVAPGLGGKIVSLRDNQTGREWLWSRQPDRHLTAASPEEGFGSGNLMGWDEILPNLIEGEWQGRALPPHGELWSSRVDLNTKAWEQGEIVTEAHFASQPLIYQRGIELEGDTLTIRYRLENAGEVAVPYLWALHPLFAIEEGDQLLLEGEPAVRVQVAPGLRQLKPDDTFDWPGDDAGLDLVALDLGELPKAGIKYFVPSASNGSVVLANTSTGAGFALHYDAQALPYLAVWLARGVWGGAHHLALEPTNRPDESLSEKSPGEDSTGWLQPGEVREWTLELVNLSHSPIPHEAAIQYPPRPPLE